MCSLPDCDCHSVVNLLHLSLSVLANIPAHSYLFIYFCHELPVIYPVINLLVYVVFVVAEDALSKPDLTFEASPTQDVWDRKTIEVCGLEPSTTHDAILLFFESNRCSGGDEVHKVQRDMDKTVAYVTFKNSGG